MGMRPGSRNMPSSAAKFPFPGPKRSSLRLYQRLEARDDVEQFLVDVTLTQTVECAVEILKQFVDVSISSFHC